MFDRPLKWYVPLSLLYPWMPALLMGGVADSYAQAGSSSPEEPRDAPLTAISETRFDFGEVDETSGVSHDFTGACRQTVLTIETDVPAEETREVRIHLFNSLPILHVMLIGFRLWVTLGGSFSLGTSLGTLQKQKARTTLRDPG